MTRERNRSYGSNGRSFRTLAVIPILAVIAALSLPQFLVTGSPDGCQVTRVESTYTGKGGTQKRVYTSNCDVFTVNDNLLYGYVTSGSVYGQIVEGKTYDFETRGVRWNFPTLFPNIISATEVSR